MQKNNFWLLAGLALLFRLVFLFALPNLSQDYFRFIWDGRLLASGWNPYEFTPVELMEKTGFAMQQGLSLFKGMGSLSAGHFSNYPPLNQLIFAIGGVLSPGSILGSVVIYRLIIILADLGTLIVGRKLLKSFGLPEHRIFWYILNPFMIIESVGNLHFEAVMVFFLLWSLYLLHHKKWMIGAIVFGLSVSVKLLPLLFLPLFFNYFRTSGVADSSSMNDSKFRLKFLWFNKLIGFYSLVFLTVVISFLPFFSTAVFNNFLSSVGLWFGKFEFNASIYYLVRWAGYQVKGYNIIETAGKYLPMVTIAIILALSFFRKYTNSRKLLTNMLFAVTGYLLLSTTVHPWYLAIPLMLSVFTEYRYMLVWSALVMLSYFAYSNAAYAESYLLISLEYILVTGVLVRELFFSSKPYKL
ncbi:mannosyltransferase [Christiangramia salexigens]